MVFSIKEAPLHTGGHIMNRISTTVLAAVCGIAALVPATPAAAAPAAPASAAVRIVLDRDGGFGGGHVSFVVDRTTVGGQRPLRLAASNAFHWLRNSYRPANPCCDRFSYRVTVTYRNGYRKTVSTVDGTPAPRVLWDVISQSQQVGVRPFATAAAAPTPAAAGAATTAAAPPA
jgi:hypothetical protein